jgi:hypothetical protein
MRAADKHKENKNAPKASQRHEADLSRAKAVCNN